MLSRVLQLLPLIYRRHLQNCQTTIHKDKKGMHRQLGVGRHGTKGIRRNKDQTQHSTSTGLLRTPRTDQDRNRGLKIRLLQNTISAMQGWEIEASGIPIRNNVRRRMQLWYTGQGTIGNSSGVPQMETIHERKSKAGTGPHRPQELSDLHYNAGTKRTTSTMDARIKSIQFQNRIPSRIRRGKTGRPHKTRGIPTHCRRPETHEKSGNLIAQKMILGYPRDWRNQARRIGKNRIPRPRGGRDTEGKKCRQGNPRHQKKPGRREDRNEGNSSMTMPMEGPPLMVPRNNLDTKRRGDTSHSYR